MLGNGAQANDGHARVARGRDSVGMLRHDLLNGWKLLGAIAGAMSLVVVVMALRTDL